MVLKANILIRGSFRWALPASRTAIETFGFSASRVATVNPAVYEQDIKHWFLATSPAQNSSRTPPPGIKIEAPRVITASTPHAARGLTNNNIIESLIFHVMNNCTHKVNSTQCTLSRTVTEVV